MVQYDDTSRSAVTGTTHGQLGPGDQAEELDCRRECTERGGDGHEAQIVYGTTPGHLTQMIENVRQAVERFGQRALATAANVSTREVGAILRGERRARQATLGKPT
ncbi:MAG: hypothetical protein M3457_22085 [Chloroflexota bacterium]|nr:hypothetical protein [Chloroflexota bacterium]